MKPLIYILPLEYPVKGGVEIKETEFIEKSAYDEAERQNAALALRAEEQAELIDKLGKSMGDAKHYLVDWDAGHKFKGKPTKCQKAIRKFEEALDEYEKWKGQQK